MAHLLVIDDDPSVTLLLTKVMRALGHDVATSGCLEDGLQVARAQAFDMVFLDVNLPDGSGLDVLPSFRDTDSRPEVVIMTGDGDPDGAETAIKNGAWDYIQKPLTNKKIELPLTRALQYRESRALKPPSAVALSLEGIIGNSPSMKICYDLLAQAGDGDMSVLVSGETGTGKELFARAVHANSARRYHRFVVVDCTVLPDQLVEAALFGHRKGAYTGADSSQAGLIRQADGGTLFLDEVGELPLDIQKTFLRVLQEKRFRAVGSGEEIHSDFRLVAATNRDLDTLAASGRFRQDLLYRIKALNIHLPQLRERPEDIKAISIYHLTKLCDRRRIGTKGVSPDFIEALLRYHWPGNVRELVNALETAIGAAQDVETLSSAHLPMQLRVQIARDAVVSGPGQTEHDEPDLNSGHAVSSFRDKINTAERSYLTELVSITRGDIKACCRLSGLSRSRFYGLLKKHGISRKF